MGYMYKAKPPFFVVRALSVDSLHYFLVGTSKYRTAFTFNEMMFSEPFLPSFLCALYCLIQFITDDSDEDSQEG